MSAFQCSALHLVLQSCGTMALWYCGTMPLHSDFVTLWYYGTVTGHGLAARQWRDRQAMGGCLDVWLGGRVDVWTGGCLDVWTFGHVDVWTCGWVDGWMCGMDTSARGISPDKYIHIYIGNNNI